MVSNTFKYMNTVTQTKYIQIHMYSLYLPAGGLSKYTGDALHALGVVGEVRARAPTAQAILGAVPGALDLGVAGEAAEAGERLGGDAPGRLDQPDDDAVALDEERVVVVAADRRHAALANPLPSRAYL